MKPLFYHLCPFSLPSTALPTTCAATEKRQPPEQRTLGPLCFPLPHRAATDDQPTPLLYTFFDQLLARGQQVMLLLDGLDEVHQSERSGQMVSQKIEDLVAGATRRCK